jgi:hypothetical protein
LNDEAKKLPSEIRYAVMSMNFTGQAKLKADSSKLKADSSKLKADSSKLKADSSKRKA